MASDEREIRTVHSIWIDAVNAGDLARLLALVAEDVVFLTPGQAPFGRAGPWCLDIGASLDVGAWCLEFPPRPFAENQLAEPTEKAMMGHRLHLRCPATLND